MCQLIPQIVISNIAEKGNEEQKHFAHHLLASLKTLNVALSSKANKLFATPKSGSGKYRVIGDCKHGSSIPGTTVLEEGGKLPSDIAVKEAYEGSGVTYDLFWEKFGRNSIDDSGMKLQSNVHYGKNYGNAFWDGSQMTYGDGDGKIFNRFTSCIDVIGHELSHGVTQYTAGLVYRNQSGALNEHFSDVFGSMVKQYSLKQDAKQADWLIGEGLFGKSVDAIALRSMKAPGTAYDDEMLGKDPQPDHMDRYVETEADAGGVHTNSGIPNKAFYIFATNLGGFSWEKPGKIWYETLTTELGENSRFLEFAVATVKVATRLYGKKSIEHKALLDAWNKVGLRVK